MGTQWLWLMACTSASPRPHPWAVLLPLLFSRLRRIRADFSQQCSKVSARRTHSLLLRDPESAGYVVKGGRKGKDRMCVRNSDGGRYNQVMGRKGGNWVCVCEVVMGADEHSQVLT